MKRRTLGTPGLGDRPPSRRRRGEPSPEEPALQGPFRRRAEVRLLAAQHHADQARPQVGCSRRRPKAACRTDSAGFRVASPHRS